MGNCGSDDSTTTNNNNGKNKPSNIDTTTTTTGMKNPLTTEPSSSSRRSHNRSDSLSSIEIDADDENELALEKHKTYHELQNAFQKKMSTGLALSNPSSSNGGQPSPSSIDGIDDSPNASFASPFGHNRSSGTNALVGGDLGKQREAASVDLVDEFFVWDDMKYDLRKDREGGGGSRPSTKGAAAGNTRKNRKNTVSTNIADQMDDANTTNNNKTSSGNSDNDSSKNGKPKAVSTVNRAKQHAFIFNDFAVDEFDFEDDDDDETSSLSFFSAAAVALSASSSPLSLNKNKDNHSLADGSEGHHHSYSAGRRRSSSEAGGPDSLRFQHQESGGSSSSGSSNSFSSQSTSNNATTTGGGAPLSSATASDNNNNGTSSKSANSPLTIMRQQTSTQFTASSSSGGSSEVTSPASGKQSRQTTSDFNSPTQQQQRPTSSSSPPALAVTELRKLGGEQDQLRNVSFTTLAGHTTRVKVLAVAPGEREYVSCSSDDFNLTYADLSTGKELGAFIGHTENVLHATFSHCGKYLSSTSRDNTMMLWDVVTQKAMLTFEHAKVVICSVFSRDSRFIATGCQDKVCRLWEARKGRELGSFAQHEGIIIAMAFAPDNTYVVSASSDRKLLKWSGVPSREQAVAALAAKAKGEKVPPPQVGKPLGAMLGHEGIILSCTFSSDGKFIISNDERLVKVWNAETCECYRTFHVDKTVPLRNLPENKKLTWTLAAAAPGCFPKHLMVAANNRFLYVFNIETEKEEVNLYCKSPIYCLTAGQRATALCGDAFGNVYCMKLGNPFLTMEPPSMATRPSTPSMNIS